MKCLYRFLPVALVALVIGCSSDDDPAPTVVTPSANSNPTITSFSSTVSETNSLIYTFTWSVSDADGDAVSCSLVPGAGITAITISDCIGTTNQEVTFAQAGSYTATLTATDANGASASSDDAVTVAEPVTNSAPTVSNFASSADAINPLTITFTWQAADTDGDTLSCSLTPGANLTPVAIADCGTTQTITYTYDTAGTYTATLAIDDGNEGTASTNGEVTATASEVTLTGTVASFPESTRKSIYRKTYAPTSAYPGIYASANASKDEAGGFIGRDDLVGKEAVISLYLLSDVNYLSPVATVKTDESGNYSIRIVDIYDYLLAQNLITESSSQTEIITAFRALGKLAVRAVIVKEEGGEQSVLAIQSIADPADLDEDGNPEPVAVDPIVNRIVKTIIDQISDAIQSLADLGFNQAIVDQLAVEVIETVAPQIEEIVATAAESQILIPEGSSFQDVIDEQEDQLELDVPPEEVETLVNVLEGNNDIDEVLDDINDGVVNADDVVDDEDSTLESTLDSETQGLLAGLNSTFTENVTEESDQALEQAEQDGNLDQVLDLAAGQTAEEALAASNAEKDRILRRSIERFFLSMGLSVMVDENEAGTAGVIAIILPAPFQLPSTDLPGGTGFGDRNIRLFKVGAGALDAASDYTTDAEATLGAPDADGIPQAPLYYAPLLADVVTGLLAGQTLETFQTAVDTAFDNITDPSGSPSEADFNLVDRVRVYNELSLRLEDSSLVSQAVINTLIENKDSSVQIKQLAAAIASNFTWVQENVSLTPEGFPLFTGRDVPLAPSDVIDVTELTQALSLNLGDSATDTARILTERESFFAQFASEAVQAAIERASFQQGPNFNLLQTLLDLYPENPAGFTDLILGNDQGIPVAPAYEFARDRVARGLTSAVPASLFGQTLTSESAINVRSALFLLDFLLRSDFLVEQADGFFRLIEILDAEDEPNNRYVPNFGNYKFMRPNDSVTIATLISELLSITLIDDGDFFDSIQTTLLNGLDNLPETPEFKELDVDEFADDFGNARVDTTDISCTVERFDGADPLAGDSQDQLELTLFAVQFTESTGEFFKGDPITVTVDSALEATDGPIRRTFTLQDIPTEESGIYGLDYVLRFSIPSYQNPLPELFFFVDGFVPDFNLCDPDFPLLIGPDQEFAPVPGLGLVSDQSRPDANGNPQVEGIDVSNLEQPGAPIYLTQQEETDGFGLVDFSFNSNGEGFEIIADAESGVGFAPLFGAFIDGELQVGLAAGDTLDPLYGIFTVLGSNVRDLLESLVADDSALTPTVAIDPESFDFDRLYVMRDREGQFWIVELRYIDVFTEPDGTTAAFIDLGFASINTLGDVQLPEAAFDDFGGGGEPGEDGGFNFYRLFYGDWLILDNPSNYNGPDILAAEQVSFGGDAANYEALAAAADGVFIRYAGADFDENIVIPEDIDTVFGNPPDFSSIPVRVDPGRPGLTFVKLSFDKQERKYIMDPTPEDAASFVTNLKQNDIIAIFDDTAADPESPAYLARTIRDIPADDPYANFELGLEVLRFESLPPSPDGSLDEREVVCFTEDNETCPDDFPALVFASDTTAEVGTVFDRDFDGVPALFDPNDDDPNIPGDAAAGGGDISNELHIAVFAESDGEGGVDQSFLIETQNVYPGDIQAVLLENTDVFGAESGQQVVFTCQPPSVDSDNEFSDFSCSALSVDGDASVELVRSSGEGVAFALTAAAGTLDNLDRVEFDYTITYRAPTDLEGNPFICGDSACPARPNSEGSIVVNLPDEISVLTDLNVTIGTGEPEDFSGVTSLDVTRDIFITGDIIPGAVEYELNIFCPGSLPGEEFKPEENLSFFAQARDETGRDVQPEFYLNIPFIGGRSCSFNLLAILEDEAGNFVGLSSITFEDVTTSGGGFFSDNELTLALGDSVCLIADVSGQLLPTNEECAPENTLFTVASLPTTADDNTANIDLGSGVVEAFADGGRKDLTEGLLSGGATISFNVDLTQAEITPPTCGSISTDPFSDTCTEDDDTTVFTEFFSVDANLTEMVLDPALSVNLTLEGPLNPNGGIPLDQPGFFVVIDDEGKEVVEVNIDTYVNADGNIERWSRFTLTAGGNVFDGADPSLQLSSPGYLFVFHDVGQPVDFDIRFIRQDSMKVAWFLPPPRLDINTPVDLNGDGTNDITATFDVDLWAFEFDSNVSSVTQFSDAGPSDLVDNGDGSFTATVDETDGRAEFVVRFEGLEYQFFAEFEPGGDGFIEFFEIFNGGVPGDPADQPDVLFDIGIDTGMLSFYDDNGFLNIENIGTNIFDVTVDANTVTIALAVGAVDTFLGIFDPAEGTFETGSAFSFDRGSNTPFFVEYIDEAGGVNYIVELFDTGFDVVVRIIDCPDCGSSGDTDSDLDGRPDTEDAFPSDPFETDDADNDTVGDNSDNCINTPNADQQDTDANGIGDACELADLGLSGAYIVTATITAQNGAECDPEEPVGYRFDFMSRWTQLGSTIVFAGLEPEENEDFVDYGTVDASGNIAINNFVAEDDGSTESFMLTAAFDDSTGLITGTVQESREVADGPGQVTVLCAETIDLVATPSTTAPAGPALAASIFFGEGDIFFDFASGEEFFEAEYGQITFDGTTLTEVFFFWDFGVEPADWVQEPSDTFLVLGANGWVEAVDEFNAGLFNDDGTATIQIVNEGQVLIAEILALESWDVSGAPMFDLVPPYWPDQLMDAELTFPSDSSIFQATLTRVSDTYEVDCDWVDDLELDCKNIVSIGFDSVLDQQIPATSLTDLLTLASDIEDQYIDIAYESNRTLSLIIRNETANIGDSGTAELVIRSFDANQMPIAFGTVDWEVVEAGGQTILEFTLPEASLKAFDLDNDEISQFFTVIADGSDNLDYVRRGFKVAAGTVETANGLYNNTAFDSILSNFAPMAPETIEEPLP